MIPKEISKKLLDNYNVYITATNVNKFIKKHNDFKMPLTQANEYYFNNIDELFLLLKKYEFKEADININRMKAKNAMNNKDILHGLVKSKNSGGFMVEVFGIDGFLPNSRIDININDVNVIIGEYIFVKIIDFNNFDKIILSSI